MKGFYFQLRLILLMFFLMASAEMVHAGNEGNYAGARAFSCGQVSGLFSDVWSVQNNPGALGFLSRNAAAVAYENRYSAFSNLSFSLAGNQGKWGCFGLAASRFGPDFFNQSRAGISWGKSFGIASLGLQGQWYQVSAKDLSSRHYFLLNFGGLAQLGEKLRFSGCISNLTQTRSSDYDRSVLPTQVKAGLSWQANSSLLLMAELQKDLDETAGLNAGLEYRFAKAAYARTGFSTASKSAGLGFGLRWRELQLDFGSGWHPELGFSHCIGLQYFIGSSAEETGKKP